jgi:hypothetical protein
MVMATAYVQMDVEILCWGGRHNFFFWLLHQERLNTRDLLQRKNMDLQSYVLTYMVFHVLDHAPRALFCCAPHQVYLCDT